MHYNTIFRQKFPDRYVISTDRGGGGLHFVQDTQSVGKFKVSFCARSFLHPSQLCYVIEGHDLSPMDTALRHSAS